MSDVTLVDIEGAWDRIYSVIQTRGEPYYFSAHLDIPQFIELRDRVLTLCIPTIDGMSETIEWNLIVEQCAIGSREAITEAIRFILGAEIRVEFTTYSGTRDTRDLTTSQAETQVNSRRASSTTTPPARDSSITLDTLVTDWPKVLQTLKEMSRVGWMVFSESAPIELSESSLTIDMAHEAKAQNAIASGHGDRVRIVLKDMYGLDVDVHPVTTEAPRPTNSAVLSESTGPSARRVTSILHGELIAIYLDVPGTGPGTLMADPDGELKFICNDDMVYRFGSFADRSDPVRDFTYYAGQAVHLWARDDTSVATPDRIAVPLFQIYLPEQPRLDAFVSYLHAWGVPERSSE